MRNVGDIRLDKGRRTVSAGEVLRCVRGSGWVGRRWVGGDLLLIECGREEWAGGVVGMGNGWVGLWRKVVLKISPCVPESPWCRLIPSGRVVHAKKG